MLSQQKTPVLRTAALSLVLVPILLTSACSIQEDKGNGDGKSDHVKISTPLGGLNVRSKDVDPASLGLPEYPGAHQLTKDEDNGNDGSVDLHMGFGPWQMRVKVITYGTTDSQDKVLAFYRKALGKYGDVIECDGHKAIGSPAVTQDGLGCSDKDGGAQTKVDMNDAHINSGDHELKAGSKHRQHIVGIKKSDSNETKFALIYLDLPTGSDQQTN
jgi:hypothetical protein